jgi:hypothetical protein
VIGQTYFRGSAFNPDACEVTHLVGFADLGESDQRTWTEMYASRGKSPVGHTFVWFRSKRKHDAYWIPNLMLPEDVFCACAYASEDALVTDRVANQGQANPFAGAQLPGG